MDNLIQDYVINGGSLITNKNFQDKKPDIFKAISEGNSEGEVILTEIGYEPDAWVNSVTAFLWYLSNEGYERIYIFGCDGGLIQGQDTVYYGEELLGDIPEKRKYSYIKDTKRMNKSFWDGYARYGINNVPDIINVTDESIFSEGEKEIDQVFYSDLDYIVLTKKTAGLE